jgi:hypothetical protein
MRSRFTRGGRQPADALEVFSSNDWSILRGAVDSAEAYLEFGSGLSTEFVSKNYGCRIRSIDTSAEWVSRVRKTVARNVEVLHVDVGPVGSWGRPRGYSHRDEFEKYFELGFEGGFSPDAVLIDGRFRVACFLTSLLRCSPGTKIVFDDYPQRDYYHVVEEILEPEEVGSRQALFIRPSLLDSQRILDLRASFTAVMD